MKYTSIIMTSLVGILAMPSLLNAETIGLDAQRNLDITIYNENRALVSDTRAADLTKGKNAIAFADVSSQIMPESALLQGKDIQLLEQNFNYDLLSESSLLEKAVGSTVTVEYINPATGAIKQNQAELLAVNGVSPILKINGKIETQYPGRVIFNKVPDNLLARPTLIMDVLSNSVQSQNLELSYLTRGLSWKADYVAELNDDENKMNLNGLVTLNNNSGVDYKNANLKLVAGDVNIVQNYIQPRMMKSMAVMESAADMATGAMEVSSLSDFYLYSLPRKTDILSNQTKQVSLLSGKDISVKKTYEFDNSLSLLYTPELKKVKPTIFISFENEKNNNLGKALPKGIVRLYKADDKGKMLFVGEDNINHTANMEKVRLRLGTAFDVFAEAKRTEYTQVSSKVSEIGVQITLKNGGDKNVTVEVYQNFYGSWRMLSESVKSENENANRVKWTVKVPAKGEAKLTYKVQLNANSKSAMSSSSKTTPSSLKVASRTGK